MPQSTLEHLPTTSCSVVSLDLPEAFAQRLKALGIYVGQRLEVARRGSPMIVKAAGGKVAIADELAKQIVVQATSE